jgi:hypothetical protein
MEKYEFDGSTTLKPLINKNQAVDLHERMTLYVYKVNKTAEVMEKIFGKSVSIAVLMSLSKAGVLAPCVAGTCGNIGYIAVKEYATVYDDYVYENNDWDLHFKLMRGVVDRLHQAGYSFNNNVTLNDFDVYTEGGRKEEDLRAIYLSTLRSVSDTKVPVTSLSDCAPLRRSLEKDLAKNFDKALPVIAKYFPVK